MLPSEISVFLSSTKFPMCTSRPVFESGRKRAKGPIELSGPTVALLEHAVGMYDGARTDGDIAQHHVRSDARTVTERDIAFEQHVGVDEHVATRR